MRVLLVEPDAATAQSIELMLKSESFNVYVTDESKDGVELACLYDYDAIITDLVLPGIDGFEAIRRIRAAKVRTPIIVLSSLFSIECKVKALGVGADDYLTKPFHGEELVARIHALVRRSRGLAVSEITTGNITLNLNSKSVTVDGVNLPMTGKEYAMFELLSLRKGMTLSKEMFLNHLYGGMDEPEVKIIDVFICKLRKKLRAVGGHQIETIWGRGYVLRDEPSHVSMAAEVAEMSENPPTGFVTAGTSNERRAKWQRDQAKRKGPEVEDKRNLLETNWATTPCS